MKICEVNDNFIEDDSIIREKAIYSNKQEQTKETFSFKWAKKSSYNSDWANANYQRWLREKYFANDEGILNKVFSDGSIVLDAGCGAGMSAIDLLGKDKLSKIHYIGVDISSAINEARQNFEALGCKQNCEFVQCDLNNMPITKEVDVFMFMQKKRQSESLLTTI